MSRDQVLTPYTMAPPVWCGDFLGRDQLLPGGLKLDTTIAAWAATVDVLVTIAYAAPGQAFAGTGNGTMTGLAASAAATSAEVWTVKLKTTAANGGTFSVTGSLSGATADAVVGTAYDNGQIKFTINDGSTDFVLNDTFTVTSTSVAAGATALPVTALGAAIPPNTTLNFGIPGMLAVTETGAAAAATSIVVLPLDRGIPNGSFYTVPGSGGHKNVPSGTVIGRTIAERDADGLFGPIADTDVDIYIVAFDVPNLDRINDAAAVRPFAGVVVKENFLPNFAGLTATQQGLVRARFICVKGAP